MRRQFQKSFFKVFFESCVTACISLLLCTAQTGHAQVLSNQPLLDDNARSTAIGMSAYTAKSSLPTAPTSKKDSINDIVNQKARSRALKSMVLPGLGQIQNGQLWKAPLVWGGLGLTTFLIFRNNDRFQEYADAFRKRTDGDSTTTDKFDPEVPSNDPPFLSQAALRDGRETFRRNRTLSVISAVAIYLANIIDAYVFAHLQDFNVSDDLSMQVRPPRFANIASQPSIMTGISLKLNP